MCFASQKPPLFLVCKKKSSGFLRPKSALSGFPRAEKQSSVMENTNSLPKLFTISGNLTSDVEIKTANTKNGPRPMALAKAVAKNGRKVTISTMSAKAIAYLTGKKSGDSVRVYGTFQRDGKAITFSAIDESIPKPRTEAAPVAEAPEAPVNTNEIPF